MLRKIKLHPHRPHGFMAAKGLTFEARSAHKLQKIGYPAPAGSVPHQLKPQLRGPSRIIPVSMPGLDVIGPIGMPVFADGGEINFRARLISLRAVPSGFGVE